MPDARLQRTRATLPEGYQFGDASSPSDRASARKVLHAPGVLDQMTLTYPCACGGRWYLVAQGQEPVHVDA